MPQGSALEVGISREVSIKKDPVSAFSFSRPCEHEDLLELDKVPQYAVAW